MDVPTASSCHAPARPEHPSVRNSGAGILIGSPAGPWIAPHEAGDDGFSAGSPPPYRPGSTSTVWVFGRVSRLSSTKGSVERSMVHSWPSRERKRSSPYWLK